MKPNPFLSQLKQNVLCEKVVPKFGPLMYMCKFLKISKKFFFIFEYFFYFKATIIDTPLSLSIFRARTEVETDGHSVAAPEVPFLLGRGVHVAQNSEPGVQKSVGRNLSLGGMAE
jgi:hypothetical protein